MRYCLTLLCCTAVACGSKMPEPGLTDSGIEEEVHDVIVVGGGLSGLTAARRLDQAGMTDILVLEARNRVGGRTVNQPLASGYAEGGGQWIGPSQTAIVALAAELGVGTFESYTTGNLLFEFFGVFVEDPGDDPISPELRAVVTELETMASTVSTDMPWAAAMAAEWDARTLGSWIDEQGLGLEDRLTFAASVGATMSVDINDLSLLYFLFYLQSAGSYDALEIEAQELRLVGGSHLLSTTMADDLGDRVRLNAAVSMIDQTDPDKVRVVSAAGTFYARRVIVAMMPSDTIKIDYQPDVSAQRRALAEGWQAGPGLKISLEYPTPFWRARGLNGIVIFEDSPVEFSFDNSPQDGSVGILMAFVDATGAPADAAEREALIVTEFERAFGAEAANPVAYAEKDWGEDMWAGGCVPGLPPGVFAEHGPALRVPHDRVHWAGTETATRWTGYMDGAIRAGERAAQEVQAALP